MFSAADTFPEARQTRATCPAEISQAADSAGTRSVRGAVRLLAQHDEEQSVTCAHARSPRAPGVSRSRLARRPPPPTVRRDLARATRRHRNRERSAFTNPVGSLDEITFYIRAASTDTSGPTTLKYSAQSAHDASRWPRWWRMTERRLSRRRAFRPREQ